MNSHPIDAAFRAAQAAMRRALISHPAAAVALALACGLSVAPAHAQYFGNAQYEHVGRTIGGELGRAAAGGNGLYTPQARIGVMIGEIVGGSLTRPMDATANAAAERERERLAAERARRQDELREAREIADAQRRARVKAAADAAYEQERRRIDPSYDGAATTGAATTSGAAADTRYQAIAGNLDAGNTRVRALVEDYQRRNAPRQR